MDVLVEVAFVDVLVSIGEHTNTAFALVALAYSCLSSKSSFSTSGSVFPLRSPAKDQFRHKHVRLCLMQLGSPWAGLSSS
jgi:hypothetical protein